MTTVPLPRMVNARSTHSRTGAVDVAARAAARPAGPGRRAARRRPEPGRAARPRPPRPSPRLDAGAAAPRASPVAGAGSARSLRVTASSPCRRPSASTAARCSRGLRRQPSSAATTNSTAGAGPSPASMLPMKRWCPGTSTKREHLAGRQRRPGVAEVDRHPAPALLGPAVGLHAGERPDQGATCRGRRGRRWRRRARCGTARRDRSAGRRRRARPGRSAGRAGSRPRSTRPTTARVADAAAAGVRRGQRDRPAAAAPARARRRRRRRRRAATTSPPTPRRRAGRSAPRAARSRVGAQARCQVGVSRPAQGRLERGEGELVDPQRPGQRVPAQPLDDVGAGRAAARPAGRRAACRRWP